LSYFNTNFTALLQRLQIPSNNITGYSSNFTVCSIPALLPGFL
jgi:hypothetical protein